LDAILVRNIGVPFPEERFWTLFVEGTAKVIEVILSLV
jgi:hypothetical protein